MFVYLHVPDELASDDKERKVLSNPSGSMAGLDNGFGGVLFIQDGKLGML